MISNAPKPFLVILVLFFLTAHLPASTEHWQIPVTLIFSSKRMQCVFGVHPDATAGYDAGLDILAPPAAPDGVYAYWQRPPASAYHLQTDLRPPNGDQGAKTLQYGLKIVNQSTTTLEWNPNDLPSDTRIILKHSSGKEIDMRENTLLSVSGSISLTIDVTLPTTRQITMPVSGWYLFSLPVLPDDRQISSLFPNALENSAYEWDCRMSTYQSVDRLLPGKGYWVPIAYPANLNIRGIALDSVRLHLAAGWNLIGAPAKRSQAVTLPKNAIIPQFIEYDILDGSYQISSFLDPGKAYWVWANQECEIICRAGSPLIQRHKTRPLSLSAPPPPPFSLLTSVRKDSINQPRLTGLSSYPNPFRDQTAISFMLAQPGRVRAIVYNTRGERLEVFCNRSFKTGRHEIIWKGTDARGEQVASGVYLIKLVFGDEVYPLKVMRLK